MKKAFVIFIIIVFSSCAGLKKNEAINNYINSYSNDTTIFVIKEKINTNKTIDIFRGKPYINPNTGKTERYEGARGTLYNEKDLEKMYKRYVYPKSDSIWLEAKKWESSDFDRINIKFLNRSDFPNLINIKNDNSKDITVYSFSETVRYGGRYNVFTVAKSYSHGLYFGTLTAIVMEKVNGKWTVIQEISDYEVQ